MTAAVSLREQVLVMMRRSISQTLRQPAMIIPPIVFPLILAGDQRRRPNAATKLPGFPADSYLDFAIAVPFMQGALFASINAGSSLARDVSTGFLQRLALTPMVRTALLLGALGGVMTVALLGALIYLAFGFIAGLGVKAGVGGVLVIVVLGAADRARRSRGSARSSACAPARPRPSRACSRCSSSSCSCRR